MNAPLRVPTRTLTLLIVASLSRFPGRPTAGTPTGSLAVLPMELPSFVAGGPVHAGDRDVVQAEIDAQDGAVVDDVVEDEAPDHRRLRHGEEGLARIEQGPGPLHLLIRHRRQRGPGCGDVLVEEVEDLPTPGQSRRPVRSEER